MNRSGRAAARCGICWLMMLGVAAAEPLVVRLESAGVVARLIDETSPARLALTEVGRFQVRLVVDPAGATTPSEIEVEVAQSGPKSWPADDLCVVDLAEVPVPIRRAGDEWHRFRLTSPVGGGSFMVRAVPPPATPGQPLPEERDRTAVEPRTGGRMVIAKWQDDRAAACCLRFDDSSPSHLAIAVPLLDEYGFRATFMVNPGRAEFTAHQASWEALARRGQHALANHTWSHRGAATEDEIDRELGRAAEYLRSLNPTRSRLLALNRGGGTDWVTRGPFRPHLERHQLFPVTGSLGMDDVYGGRVEALDRHLAAAIVGQGWAKVHFHTLGDGQATSLANFMAELETVKARASQLWIATLTEAYQYQVERSAAALTLLPDGPDKLLVTVTCTTDPDLYDQPLTLRFDPPAGWATARLSREPASAGGPPEDLRAAVREANRICWRVPPTTSRYRVSQR